jgi:hypothetical protein
MNLRKSLRNLAVLSAEALLICNIFLLFNLVLVSLILPYSDILYFVALITILEGGIGLTIGGFFVVAAGPTITKVSEKVLHGEPYSAKRARDAEARARLLFFFSFFLLAIGFLLNV